MQAWTWLQGKRSSSEMKKKCALLLSKILNCPELWLGVVWNSIRVVLCWGREGGEAFLEALGVDIMYWILCEMLPFESGKGLRLQKSTSHVICPKTARLKCLVHLFFLSFSRALEGECDRFGWWLLCVYMWFSVVLKKTKSAEESLSLLLAGTENEASSRKSGARRFTHKGNC